MRTLFVCLAMILTLVVWPRPALAAPVRILIAAGASAGLSAERPLSHPKDDASSVRDVLTTLGGVAADHTFYLPDVTKSALLGALDRAQELARRYPAGDVTLVVYFSGHGDHEALHIRGESLPLAELSARMAAVPAGLRIVVVDACRTDTARAKGMTVQPGFAVSLSGQAATTGTAWFYAAADGEAAQESDEIGGAIFTHFWLAGLRGAADANADGRVTLDESFAYAYSQTLVRSARSGGVIQRPQAKLELSEASPVVVTELAGERAQLEFPRDTALYLVYAVGSQSVVAEVYGLADRAVRIVLPKGRYVIQKRVGTRGAAVDSVLRGSSTRVLSTDEFRTFPGESLALKGGLVVRPWSLEVVTGVLAGREVDIAGELGVRVAHRDAWGYAVGPLAGLAKYATPYNKVSEVSVGGEASLDRFFDLAPAFVFRAGMDVRGEWIGQSVRRADADRAAAAGFATTTRYSGTAWGGGGHAGARLSITPALYMDVGARVLGLAAKSGTGVDGRLLGGGFLALGAAL